jgi:hypothetical protein
MVHKLLRLAPQATVKRRTGAEIQSIRDAIFRSLQEDHPATVRGVFYRMVEKQVVPKEESQYKGTIGRLLVRMRRERVVPFGWITDGTRWMRKARTHDSVQDALDWAASTYRRSLWSDQPVYVEIWCEKEALAGVLLQETDRWDVPLMVSRGFSSLTYLYEAAETIALEDKPTFIYYFGDHDPSGVHVDRRIERDLREFAPDAEIHFERVAVTEEQIHRWRLPTRRAEIQGS